MADSSALGGADMVIGQDPCPGERRFEIAIDEQIGSNFREAAQHKFQVVNVNVASGVEEDKEVRAALGRGGTALDGARVSHIAPPGGIRPIADARVVFGGVDELQRGPLAIGGGGPRLDVLVFDFSHDDLGPAVRAGAQQSKRLAVVLEIALELIEWHGRVRAESSGIRGQLVYE